MVVTRSQARAMARAGQRTAAVIAANYAQQAARRAANVVANQVINRITNGTPISRGRNMPRTPVGPQYARTARWGRSVGKFVGKFSKVYKKKARRYRTKLRKSKRSMYKKSGKTNEMVQSLKYGYHVTREMYGTVTDPHIGYIIHSTNEYNYLARIVIGAMVRKLFKKAGFSIESRDQTLPLETITGSGPDAFIIKYVQTKFSTNLQIESLYEIPANASLEDILENMLGLNQLIVNYWRDSEADELTHLRLYMRTTVLPTDERRLVAELDLKNEQFHFCSTSKLKVQNRTKGDTNGSDNDADRIDNMPVYGKLYEFQGGNIKLRTVNNSDWDYNAYFNCMPANGLSLVRGAEIPEYEEPPTGKHFMNNVSQVKVYLNPGDIKYASISYNFSGKFKTFMDKFKAKNYGNNVGAAFRYAGIPGKTQMVVLEEVIRSISSNPIVLVYERQIQMGGYLTSKKRAVPFTTQLTSQAINNLPPE